MHIFTGKYRCHSDFWEGVLQPAWAFPCYYGLHDAPKYGGDCRSCKRYDIEIGMENYLASGSVLE